LDCGADRFTIDPSDHSEEYGLKEFYLGIQRLIDPAYPQSFSRKTPVWRFSVESLFVVEEMLAHQEPKHTSLAFYRRGAPLSLIHHDGAQFSLWQEQMEYLFRLGFEFFQVQSKGAYKQFTSSDLSENRRPSVLPRLTLDQMLQRPYGLESHKPSRGIPAIELNVLQNLHIRLWWTSVHDDVLRAQIARDGLAWWPAVPSLLRVTDANAICLWRQSDPACLTIPWKDMVVSFARARAQVLELHRSANLSGTQRCASCDKLFKSSIIEARIRDESPHFKRVPGFYSICNECISTAYTASNESTSRDEMLVFARSICENVGRIPSPSFGLATKDYESLTESQLPIVVRLLAHRPAKHLINQTFGSWLQLLIESGVLAGEVRRTSRGTQCLAKDGHFCLSLGEKIIDDILHELGISHIKEAKYPGTNLRSDFLVESTYIEYFGLTGNPEYDAKTRKKLELCEASGWQLLAIFPEHLLRPDDLRSSLLKLAS
jgi:hypothetical protein